MCSSGGEERERLVAALAGTAEGSALLAMLDDEERRRVDVAVNQHTTTDQALRHLGACDVIRWIRNQIRTASAVAGFITMQDTLDRLGDGSGPVKE